VKRQAREVYGFVPRHKLRTVSAPRVAQWALAAVLVVFVGVLTWPR
jgi:hypothetical protein